ncbi:hypothetical protein HYS03_02480, partial [Candidatus Woesebacteria bacterium]|nr:hypothetical protein [Candidatus Woesebacteria bacterium]
MPDSEEEKIGKFMRAVSISARNKNEAEVHSQQDRLILLGPGSLQNWYEGRKSFDLLAQAIHQQIKVKDTYVSIQWLGYRDPGFSYSKKDTVIQSISDFAYQFDDFLKFYRRSVVDMVCHSLMGTIALYWAITRSRAKSDTVKRVRSITIINSPLRGSDKYWEAYKANFLEKNRPFLGSQ